MPHKLSKSMIPKKKPTEVSEEKKVPPKPPLILIDGSHFCFWRYTATRVWWSKHSGLGEEDDCHIEHDVFVEKFTKHFKDSVAKIQKQFRSSDIIWCRDAPKEQVWRMPLHEEYKEGRVCTPNVGSFIKYSYDALIPKKQIIRTYGAEADDVLATICIHEHQQNPDRRIYIVSGDTDFLQLVNDVIQVVDPKKKFKALELPANTTADIYLRKKILAGDKSDNIPQVPKCGPKTADRLARDPIAFKQEIEEDEERWAHFLNNQQLIDFAFIPKEIQDDILQSYKFLRKPHLKLSLQRKQT